MTKIKTTNVKMVTFKNQENIIDCGDRSLELNLQA